MYLSPEAQSVWDEFQAREDVKDRAIARYRHFARKNSVGSSKFTRAE